MAQISESSVQRDIRGALQAMGWWVIRVNSGQVPIRKSDGEKTYYMQLAPNGTPDLLAIAPQGGIYLWVETKRPSVRRPANWPKGVPFKAQRAGTLSEEQIRIHAELRSRGCLIIVAYTLDGFFAEMHTIHAALGLPDSPFLTYDLSA